LVVVAQGALRGRHLYLTPQALGHLRDELLPLGVVLEGLALGQQAQTVAGQVGQAAAGRKQQQVPLERRGQGFLDKVMRAA
jgi:hypothetical protein